MTKLFSASLLVAAALVACSDGTGTTTGQTSGSSGTQPGSSGTPDQGTSGTPDNGTSGTPAAKSPEAPLLTELMKMTGSLHVMWALPQATTCDAIEGERKTASEPYKVVWTTPGSVDNKHDGSATKDAEYTYRLRCKVGTTYSAYSNEMSKNPLK